MKGIRAKGLRFFLSAVIFIGIFTLSLSGQIKSNPHVYKTGLLFQNPEYDQNAIQGSRFIEILKERGKKAKIAASHFNYDYLPPVNSQGSQGSCVAWAVGYYLKSYQENKENNRTTLSERSQANNICSPSFIYNIIHGKDDSGAYFSDAFRVTNDFGCASLADTPYDESDYQTWPDETDFENAIPNRTQCSSGYEYYYLTMVSDSNLGEIKLLLTNGHLVTFGIYVYSNFDNIETYNNIYTLADKTGDSRGGHAQTIVGFDDDKVTNDGTGAFRVVNSWGTNWGDNGFYWISYEAIKQSSELSQGYAHWIDDRDNYSSDKKAVFKFTHDYSRETETWVSAGGESIYFFDFYVNTEETEYRSFPNSNIVLDIKALNSYLSPGAELHLHMEDTVLNEKSGIIASFCFQDDAIGFQISSSDTPVTIADASQDYANITIPSPSTPIISLNKTHLIFGATTGINNCPDQHFLISNTGEGSLSWSISDDAAWITCTPTAGGEDGKIVVSINSFDLGAGTYTGTITISSPEASNSPQTVSVSLQVYAAGADAVPFGSFDTPLHGSTVASSVPLTGWALDDIGVNSIRIYRDPITGEGANLVYIGDAMFVEGARPDVESLYPDYPLNYQAGWGYMLLTNFLPDQGNGTFVLYAIATDTSGNNVILGSKTIYCDNADAVKPFGAIDTPTQGGTASGTAFVNFGWALTPLPNSIPTDGSTINVFVDGVNLGHPFYNNYRSDIATLFPGYANSDGAVGVYMLDTTAYANGVHSIVWGVADNVGNADGIGSRYFSIFNGSSGDAVKANRQRINEERITFNTPMTFEEVISTVPSFDQIAVKKGYREDTIPVSLQPDSYGVSFIEIKEVERLVISLNPYPLILNPSPSHNPYPLIPNPSLDPLNPYPIIPNPEFSSLNPGTCYTGYLLVGNELRPLPLGSYLNPRTGIFSWQPGPGFLGEYELVFIKQTETGAKQKIKIKVNIVPKFNIPS